MKKTGYAFSYKRRYLMLYSILLTAILIMAASYRPVSAAGSKAYTVKASSQPIDIRYKKYSTYNDKTKQYYMLRSYLEQLEKEGGGTLILSKGTYTITNSLYVSSRVTIMLKDGVKLTKGNDTGTSKMLPARSMFQLVSPSKSNIKGVYGGYEGETAIRILGEGTAVIDLKYVKDSIGIVLCHNKDIIISGITFQNMCSGHFIELDASSNVTVEKCKFLGHKPSDSGIKEAINLDTPDKSTGGICINWTNYDCTPDKDVIIKDNTFNGLERAIGTHKYSGDKYHFNIQILNNKISNMDSDAIRILNWDSPILSGNEIRMVAGGSGTVRAILASGVKNPTITKNTFIDVARPIQIMPWKNHQGGSQYEATYNEVSGENIERMLTNYLFRVGEKFIRINKTLDVFIYDTEKYYYLRDYLISEALNKD